MTALRDGGCQCGALRFRIRGEPLSVCACHCTDCQRRSGSAFGITLFAARSQVELVRGEPARYDYAEADGRRWLGTYCPRCAVRLWSESPRVPEVLFLAAGTLDDRAGIEPVAHVWLRSARPWVRIPDHVLTFERQPDMETLVRAWRERRR
jgi:hypothetical protein